MVYRRRPNPKKRKPVLYLTHGLQLPLPIFTKAQAEEYAKVVMNVPSDGKNRRYIRDVTLNDPDLMIDALSTAFLTDTYGFITRRRDKTVESKILPMYVTKKRWGLS
jgi:cytochrome c1